MSSRASSKLEAKNKEGLTIPTGPNKLSRFGGKMMDSGRDTIQSAIDTIIPSRNMYRRRNRFRDE